MLNLNEQYITDKNGNRTAVVIPIDKFEELQFLLTETLEMPDYQDVTSAVVEGLQDVRSHQTIPMEALLNALRD